MSAFADILRALGLRRKPRPPLSASHNRLAELKAGMSEAERALALKNTARNVRLECLPGRSRIGHYWGVEERKGYIVGGRCTSLGGRRYRIDAYCDPASMAPHPHTLLHECGHVLLFERGVPMDLHHARMREVGIL